MTREEAAHLLARNMKRVHRDTYEARLQEAREYLALLERHGMIKYGDKETQDTRQSNFQLLELL